MENESKIMSMYHSINSYGIKQINPSSESEYYSPLYGELTYRGTQSIIKSFSSYFNKNTVFYDFGSGLGKMVIHLGNLIPPIKKSIGIEYSLGRYEGAVNLAKDSRLDNDKIKFINGNFFTTDVSDATVIYIDNYA